MDWVSCLTIFTLALAFLLPAQVAATEADARLILFPYYARQAEAYEFFLDENGTQRLLLKEQPVLTWTNAADNYMGGVFLWTHRGRPEVVACIGSRQTPTGECIAFHELHSLSLGVVPAVKFGDGKRIWKPTQAGVELRDVDGAPQPADSERQRLTQMRNLAREFTGWIKQDGDITELRLLPQPFFRYTSDEQGV